MNRHDWLGPATVAAMAAVSAASTLLIVQQAMVFGSAAGGWVYPYVQPATANIWGAAMAAAVLLPIAFAWLRGAISDQRALAVVSWMAIALACSVLVRWLYPVPLPRIVAADCTSFYLVPERFSLTRFLADFETIRPSLPFHAGHNMPGKTVLYYGLRWISDSAQIVGLGMIALSLLTVPLVFVIGYRVSGRLDVAALAMVLSSIFPAKFAFDSIPNAVSPIWILVAFWVWVEFLNSRRTTLLWLLGATLYVVMFMDPLLFAAGVIFLGYWRTAHPGSLTTGDWVRVVTYTTMGFLAVHVMMSAALGFDIFSVLIATVRAATEFNVRANRPYGTWVIANVLEFVLAVGVVPALVVVVTSVSAPRSTKLALPITVCVLVLDVMGVNRGEVTRLWLFLGVFVQVAAAEALMQRAKSSAYLAIAAVAAQSMFTATTVGFLMC